MQTSLTRDNTDFGCNNNIMSRMYSCGRGTPFDSREDSVQAMRALMMGGLLEKSDTHTENIETTTTNTGTITSTIPEHQPFRPHHNVSSVHGEGPLLLSDIPKSARQPGVCVGIDEAGRGSVLGPMVYGAAFWNASLDEDAQKIPHGFRDSKQLSEDTRADLLEKLMASPDIGWSARILQASEISRNMLRTCTYNLNLMSHGAAMAMIQAIQDAGVPIQTCYIDTVGNPDVYRRKLERAFPNLQFVVESKADAKYATCSAASVVAKVLRDRMLENWKFTEPLHAAANSLGTQPISRDFGSGYPSDPKCKEWMGKNLRDPVFGWPDVVRFSWGPAKKALLKDAAFVKFEADNDDDDNINDESMMDPVALAGRKRQQEQMSAFLKRGKKDPRFPYFERTNLQVVTNLF